MQGGTNAVLIFDKKSFTFHHDTNTPLKHVPIEHLFSPQNPAWQLEEEALHKAPAVDIWKM